MLTHTGVTDMTKRYEDGPDYSPAESIVPKSRRPAKRRAIYDTWLEGLSDNEIAREIAWLENTSGQSWQIDAAQRELEHRL